MLAQLLRFEDKIANLVDLVGTAGACECATTQGCKRCEISGSESPSLGEAVSRYHDAA